jgi:cytochrome c peroxidase
MKRVQTLGKLMLYDKQLSVNKNQACAFCHMPDVDFTGSISILNMTTVSYPGSVRNASADPAQSRYGRRKPQSYTYSPYYPISNTTRRRGISMAGTFGICAPPAPTCKIPRRNRRRVLRLILTK